MKQLGYVQDTTLSSAQGLPSVPTGARWALLQAETQNIRWRDDGVAPTATVGMLLVAGGTPYLYQLGALGRIQLIEATASAKLNVTYYG